MTTISTDTGTVRNFSLFPYSAPFGVLWLWLAWRRQSVLWVVVALIVLGVVPISL